MIVGSVNEKRNLNNELVNKVRNKYNIMNVSIGNDNEVKVMFNNNGYNSYYNDIVLYNIGKELNVDELINKLVEKYSK